MTTVDLVDLCIPMGVSAKLSITLPGGIKLSAVSGMEKGSASAIVRGFLAQINTALAPLQPFFNLLELILALGECIQAVPKILVDPTALASCIERIIKALPPLAALIPQLSIPRTVKEILGIVLTGLVALRDELQVFIREQQRIAEAAILAALPGNEQLQAEVDCANANFATQMANMGAAMTPLNQLIEILNLLLKLAGLGSFFIIPTVADLGPDPEAALVPLDAAIDAITAIYQAIPI